MQVVFTVEATADGARYLVRPVVYCAPTHATFFETSLFTFNEPDAWPISAGGTISTGPLRGRFTDRRAVLKVAAGGTCLAPGKEIVLRPATTSESLSDGSWSVTLAPHPEGGIGDTVTFFTRGEGALIDSDWGVSDGGPGCYLLRTGLELLVSRDGSFTATINGNQLQSEGLTLRLSGRFVTSNVAEGSYKVTGPNPLSNCIGQSVSFTAVFSTPSQPPKPSTGPVKLYRPNRHHSHQPGRGRHHPHQPGRGRHNPHRPPGLRCPPAPAPVPQPPGSGPPAGSGPRPGLLIQHASWVYDRYQDTPTPRCGWSLHVTPTLLARVKAGDPLFALHGWKELYRDYKNVRHGIKHNVDGLMKQYECHAQFVAIRSPRKPTWNLDEWRPDVSYLATVRASCNP